VSTFVLGLGSGLELATICTMNHRIALGWAGALGATGVVTGALGAHSLKAALLAAGTWDAWETATSFQLVHAAALLGFAGWLRASPAPAGKSAAWAVRLWVLGTLLFSGSIYGLSLGAPHWLGPVTPLGGLALISAWALAACAVPAP
jgi:uncharacterized membrane protein YgdD (TMEM256/DUF423 family)